MIDDDDDDDDDDDYDDDSHSVQIKKQKMNQVTESVAAVMDNNIIS